MPAGQLRNLVPLLLALVCSVSPSAAQQKECECVDYWLCDNGRIVTDGTNLLDVRQKTCPGVEVCCLPPDDPSKVPPVTPEQPPRPTPPPVTPPWRVTPQPQVTDTPSEDGDAIRLPSVASGGGCGRRRFPPGTNFKVTGVNGGAPEKTYYGEAPWMVVLLRDQEGQAPLFTCGGTLISRNIVLTAAHCVNGSTDGQLTVRAGEYNNRRDKPLPAQTVRVSRVSVHPDYNSGNLRNDIAILFLEKQMEINEVVDVVCGPEGAVDVNPKGCYVTGWGRNSTFGRYQPTLSRVNLELRDREYCQDSLRKSRLGKHFILHEGFICAGGGDNRDTCSGDGGGPLVCPSSQDSNKMIQMGIVSWGIGCGEGYPTVLVSVKHYLQWISSQLS